MLTINPRKKTFVPAFWSGVLLIILAMTLPQPAQALSWNPSSGPYGGSIGALAIDPANSANLYAGTSGGEVFASTDNGLSWSASVSGLGGKSVTSIAVDPTASSTLYAGTLGGGVYKSTDGGVTWNISNSGLSGVALYVNVLAVDPSASNILYAGTSNGVFKSSDSGASWNISNTGSTYTSIRSIVIDPSTPNTLYAGIFFGGVYKSSDGGVTWSASSTGLSSQKIVSLAIDPAVPTTLYAGTEGSGINKSIDGGATWSPSGLLGHNVYAVAVDPNTSSSVYAGTSGGGVFRSTDSGASWNATNTGMTATDVRTIAVDPVTSSTVYVGTKIGEGIFKSTDSGANWSTSNTGLTSLTVNSLAMDPVAPTTLYAGTSSGGVFKSLDRGANWSPSNTGVETLTVNSVVPDPVSSSILYAATKTGGVFKSIDSGGSWVASNNGLTNLSVNSLAIDPLTSTLYAATSGGGVFAFTNGGTNWSAINTGLTNPYVRALAFDQVNSTLYAGTNGGVFSYDGASWSQSNIGLTSLFIYSLAVDSTTTPSTLYAGASVDRPGIGGGIFMSVDGGQSWNSRGLSGLTVNSIAIDPAAPATLYAGTSGGAFMSTDSGATWMASNTGLGNLSVQAIAVDPQESSIRYVGVTNGGVQQSVDEIPPVITLLGSDPMTVAHGSVYAEPGTAVTDNVDTGLEANVVVTGTVNTNAVGTYVLTYDVSDAAGNAATPITRTVNVTDQTAPVITLLGNNPLIVAHGSVFADPGSTVSDNVDTVLTATVTGTVDTSALGSYTLTYDASDAAGNATTVTRTVMVTDQTPPVITLLGNDPMTVAHGSVFTEPGSTVTDNIDTGLVTTVTGNVDTNAVGSYVLTYDVSDAAGNAAIPITRTVNVTDQTAPVITLLGNDPMIVAHGSVFTDPGSNVSDNVDNGLVATMTGTVDTNTLGSYTITYDVSDAAGNATSVTRTVTVTDQTAPVITLLGNDPMTVAHGSVFTEPGSTVSDNIDTGLVATIAGTVDTNAVGTYVLTYNASDAAGNTSSVTRTVHVTDQTAPVITLLGNEPMTVAHGSVFTDPGSSVSDNVDTGLVATMTGTVDTNALGTYVLTYSVSDAAGNATAVTRTVNVTDQTPPVISMLGNNPMIIAHGSTFTDPGATASDNIDTGLAVFMTGAVDTTIVGEQFITYHVSDAAGNVTTVNRIVNVTDQTAPVITLVGSDPLTVAHGSVFTDPGTVVEDNVDTNLHNSVSGTVDMNTVGSYVITYSAVDAAGNTAVPVTRTINVTDQTAPVIKLLGKSTVTLLPGATFTDPGSEVTDNVDTGLTATRSGTVDTSTIGTYTLTYAAADSAGNSAEVSRTVNVMEVTATPINGGGGALDWASLLWLLSLGLWGRLPLSRQNRG